METDREQPETEPATRTASFQPSVTDLPDIGNEPNQPRRYQFPKRPFGKKNVVYRSFQPAWFDRWQWLHYDSLRDLAFCFTCVKAIKTGKMKLSGNMKDSSLIFNGFHSWKEAVRCLNLRLYMHSYRNYLGMHACIVPLVLTRRVSL